MKLCRLGIIGAGRIGKLHAENVLYRLPQFELVGIADPNIDLNWAQSLGIPLITTNSDDLIFHHDIDALIIASPSHLHAKQIMAASQANKAIFCEKPIGLTEEEIQICLDIVEQYNTYLQIGFNRRFDPDFAAIAERVRNGEIGAPHLLKITSRDPSCPSKEYIQSSGGLFMDMAIHDFDMARFIMNSEITEVYAAGANLINPDFAEYNDIDTAVIQLRFANGALGVIDNSRQAVYGYDQRVEIFGSEGMLIANHRTENNVTHYQRKQTQSSNPLYFFLERYENAYLTEMRSFYEAWNNLEPSPVNGHDGLQALRIANAAKKSLQNRAPVAVTQFAKHVSDKKLTTAVDSIVG